MVTWAPPTGGGWGDDLWQRLRRQAAQQAGQPEPLAVPDPWRMPPLPGDRRASATGSTGSPGGSINRAAPMQAANAQPSPFYEGFMPADTYGGDQLGGSRYVEGRGWVAGNPLAAGFEVGSDIGRHTGVRLPVGYDPRLDTVRGELNGKWVESAWSRVLRFTSDAIRNGQDGQTALNNAIAMVNREAAAQGKTSGFGGAPAAPGQTPAPAPAVGAGVATAAGLLGNGATGAGAPGSRGGPQRGTTFAPQTAATGGESVSANLDPGIPGGSVDPTKVNGAYDLALQNDPTRRMAALFAALGIGSPSQQHSWAGSNMMNIAQSLYDPWAKTQGLGGTTPTTMDMIAQFAKYMGAGGGGAGSIRSDAANAMRVAGAGGGAFAGLNDQELAPLLQGFSGLAHVGQNPYLQKGYAGLADDAIGQFANTLNAADASGKNTADLRLLQFLADNPTYRFLTGR